MPKSNYRSRYRFRAVVDFQVNARHYKLLNIYNIDLNKPFRNHLWITWTVNNPFPANREIEFNGTIYLYRKRSGKLRFGIKDPSLIRVLN